MCAATDEALVIESQKLRRKHTFNPEASSICVGVVYASDLNAEAKAMLTTDIKVRHADLLCTASFNC